MFRTFRRVAILVVLASASTTTTAHAATQALGGTPLSVFVGDLGQPQARFTDPTDGSLDGFFFAPGSTTADSGFHLRTAGGSLFDRFGSLTPVSNGPVTGAGSTADPRRVTTVYNAGPLARITQVTRYVDGERGFTMTWTVTNTSGAALRFRSGFLADVFVDGSDGGVGVFAAGPPRFVGSQNALTNVVGGSPETLSSQLPGEIEPTGIPPWAGYASGDFDDVYSAFVSSGGLQDTIVTADDDKYYGVEWEDHLPVGQGLAPGASQRYELSYGVSASAAGPVSPTVELSAPSSAPSRSSASIPRRSPTPPR